jgi:hypothetical protein
MASQEMAPVAPGKAEHAKALTLKDWLALFVSLIALTISGIGAYFTILRVQDNVSVIFAGAPIAYWNEQDELSVFPDKENVNAIFINSGNRPAVIIWINLFFIQHATTKSDNCAKHPYGNEATFQTDFEPLVVKEREVLTKKLKTSISSDTNIKKKDDGNFAFPLMSELRDQSYINVTVCAAIRIATPSVATHDASVFVFKYTAERGKGVFVGDTLGTDPDWGYPQLLIKETSTIFGQ